MSDRLAGIALALAIIVIGIPGPLHAQGLTGQLSGTITDTTGAVLPGVTIVIKNVGTGLTRETVTGNDGAFQFPDLLAGTFDLTATMPGFKTYEQKGIEVASTDRLRLRAIALAIGGLTETVTVQAEAVQVQTSSGARSGLLTRQNLEDIALKGRDFAGMLKLLPGVIDTRNREAPGWEAMNNLSINGRTSFNYTYDGVTNKDTGQNAGNFASPGLDSIAEVRVQSSNFQAEYGRSSGATISVITRSGSKDFHGSAAFYKRDTKWNANEYSRRINCNAGQTAQCDPPLYKYDNPTWTIGGPVLVPGTGFNKSRSKLFFFWSQDLLRRTDPGNLNTRRVPTVLERQGDFSQTFDNQNRLLRVRDPLLAGNCNVLTGGPACFPGNIIPANRIDPNGRALLNLLPLPNATDPTGANQYNYTYQTETNQPRNDQVLRIDWNVAPNTTAYGRLQFGYEKRAGGVAILGSTSGWPQMATKYEIDTVSYVNTLLHTFSPTLYGEVTVGVNWSHQNTSPIDDAARDANDRRLVLPGMPQFFPDANPLGIIPQASFGGGPQGTIAGFGVEQRFPFFGYNTLFNASANLTKLKGAHTMKAGLFIEHTTRPAARTSSFNGNFNFDSNASNPLNTNIGYANALTGAITAYTESDGHPSAHGQFMLTEWYAQDNWRVKRNFTVDAGVRFYYMTPTQSKGDQIAQFEPGEWNSAQAPRLYTPVSTPQGRLALNPLTGEILPAVYIGRLVPGSGNFTNGMHVYDGTPHDSSPFRVAPRIGFAWDMTGDGKTAMRGGAGVFYDRYQDDEILQLIELPPVLNSYTTNYTTISALLASPLSATPTGVRRIEKFTPPVVYNWSLGVQRDIGFNLIADAAYVGNAGRNQLLTVQLNGRPYGYLFLPSSLDPTNLAGGQARPMADDFLRPYQGFGQIQQRQFSGYSDYHALQVSMSRRRSADGLSVGASYTYQILNKSLGVIDPFIDDTFIGSNAARNYTSNGRRPHVLAINYSYTVPNLSQKWNNLLVKAVLDNWQFSGVTTLSSGTYGGFGATFVNVPTGVLSGTGAINGQGGRAVILCDPNLPPSERTFERQFKTECVGPPTDEFQLGTATNDEYLGVGTVNWDISVFKSVPMGGARSLQLRLELYNAFNTEQWNGANTNAQFDYTTHALTNANVFGRMGNGTASARRIQLGARFRF